MANEIAVDKWRGNISIKLVFKEILLENYASKGESFPNVASRLLSDIACKYKPSKDALDRATAQMGENMKKRMNSREVKRQKEGRKL